MGKHLGPWAICKFNNCYANAKKQNDLKATSRASNPLRVTSYVQMRNTAQCSVSTSQVPVHATSSMCFSGAIAHLTQTRESLDRRQQIKLSMILTTSSKENGRIVL